MPRDLTRPRSERHCCDGLCVEGRICPAFAPGVIQGPYPRRRKAHGVVHLGVLWVVGLVAALALLRVLASVYCLVWGACA